MSERNYYVICENNCRFPAMTKEQIYAAIAEATGNVPTGVDNAFITKVKSDGEGADVSFWVGTEAEFNEITPKPSAKQILMRVDENGKVYICTDDTAVSDLASAVYQELIKTVVPRTGGNFTGDVGVPTLTPDEIYLDAGQDKTGGKITDYSYTIKPDTTNHTLKITSKADNGTSPSVYTPILLNADGTATIDGTITNATNAAYATNADVAATAAKATTATTANTITNTAGNKFSLSLSDGYIVFTGDGAIRRVNNARMLSADNNATISVLWLLGDVWSFTPNTDNTNTLGSAAHRWSTAYLGSAAVVSSDRNQKNSISNLTAAKAEKLIKNLKPVTYKYNEGTSNRTHWGLIAQDVESAMTAAGLTDLDFAGFIKSPKYEEVETQDENGETVTEQRIVENEYIYALRYEEFIAPLIALVKKQSADITALKTDIDELKKAVAELQSK